MVGVLLLMLIVVILYISRWVVGGFWIRKGNWRRDRRGGKIYMVMRKIRVKKMELELFCFCVDV